ncbi:aliphatic amidase [Thermoplasma volcanium GSS1]|uniref:Aliphatic amidase n=1 Tax=Thermoplasma volcanium (strain ATCC 51530 / DSM 4299 / JCM 9571 / NBRC 15438 / GSS1) TaxID=273116 RepID=Q978Y4_THEVO|nr:carbon-nitrogen hydrolase family protein [Thermoplasma volcanium]BAB60422.1 aliphatic amidase [Thermoplasma volcanium GSS1]
MRVTVVQMASTSDKSENIEKTFKFLDSIGNSNLIIFPEYQIFVPDFKNGSDMINIAESESGEFMSNIANYAKERKSKILVNIPEKNAFNLKPFNTAVLIDELGTTMKYRKLHLFDAFNFKESAFFEKGNMSPMVFNSSETPFGVQICYDLRFPEAARILTLYGAKILVYQAGWFSGERKYDQWKTLLRARAMENGVFVIGSAQTGDMFTGHSMVVSPYGDVVAELDKDENYISMDIDLGVVEKYRSEVPLLKERRTDIYDVLDVSLFEKI